jgi:hypothetical protein
MVNKVRGIVAVNQLVGEITNYGTSGFIGLPGSKIKIKEDSDNQLKWYKGMLELEKLQLEAQAAQQASNATNSSTTPAK